MKKSEKRNKNWDDTKAPPRNQPVFKIFKKVFRHIFKAKVESMIEELPDKAIIVSIHAAKKGPTTISVNYPKFHAMWGHHGMLGGYIERYKYLRNVLYIQKMHKNKIIASLKATYEAAFSILIYKGMNVIGTYTDMQFLSTVRKSMAVLDDNASVVIFPEDSSEGYFDEIRHSFPGFVMLSATYYQKNGEDVPIIPAYISNKHRRFILGEPKYVREMERSGMTKQEIADNLGEEINKLYREYIATGRAVEVKIKNAPVRTRAYYDELEQVRSKGI